MCGPRGFVILVILFEGIFLAGCSGVLSHPLASAPPADLAVQGQPIPLVPELPETPLPNEGSENNSSTTPEEPTMWKGLTICSDLDFSGVSWSKNISLMGRDPFALALNLSGSFEGHNGWSNLTGNFDGQGISMGLLNQNLGQGSLQPMWSEMRLLNRPALQKLFSDSNLKSIEEMLRKWESSTSSSAFVDLASYGYSELDDLKLVAAEMGVDPLDLEMVTTALIARNQASVDWAKRMALSGTSIKSTWVTPLKAMSLLPEYRSIQMRKGERIHNSAVALVKTYGFKELRAYLFMFDIVVQNGSISETVKRDYFAWAKINAGASEKQKLTKLLELRLRTLSTWKEDVRLRKMSIINGVGTVHGSRRDYTKEYCANLSAQIAF